jgi:poly-beta-1,6-N-acetyl-D-glucosamine synthase
MWLIPSAVYWSSLGFVGYTYAGYPLLIKAWSKLRPKAPLLGEGGEPRVSVVMAAHNEATQIGRKLENLLDLEYPREKLQIIVIDDGSTDETAQIIGSYSDQGVELVSLRNAVGKASAINQGMLEADGDVILFCDVRQRIDPLALRSLLAAFADPKVGAVSGELVLESDQGPGVYWKYEKAIRGAESAVDSLVGATGALYAIRRALFRDLPDNALLDDVFTPMQIALQGYRVLLESNAKVFDREADVQGEFARKARTLAGNYQILGQLPKLLNPIKNRLFFQYASHKLCRLLCPFALTTLFASNIYLVATGAPGWPFYVATLTGQLGAYGLALKGALDGDNAGKLARISYTFVALNAAAVEGLRRYLRGDFGWTTLKESDAATQ